MDLEIMETESSYWWNKVFFQVWGFFFWTRRDWGNNIKVNEENYKYISFYMLLHKWPLAHLIPQWVNTKKGISLTTKQVVIQQTKI